VKNFPFAKNVLAWFDEYGRKTLPWKSVNIAQQDRPYHIWLSEIMLQQTQVTTVIPYYQRFIKSFPTLQDLAKASQDDVLNHWAGLGYYARGRNLHKAAQQMWNEYHQIPNDFEALLAQPGIGRSTAGAIMAQAFNESYPILDGNVKRVLARFHAIAGWPGKSAVAKLLWEQAERHTPSERVADYTQAIMDLGAMVCTRSKPKCTECPLQMACQAKQLGQQNDYPGRKPKKDKPSKSIHVLCLIVSQQLNQQQEILLEQRPPTGIWGGLWSFPEYKTLQELDDHLSFEYNRNESDCDSLDTIQHAFSHYHLTIHPHVLSIHSDELKDKVAEGGHLFPLSSEQTVGLPAPMQKLLERLIC